MHNASTVHELHGSHQLAHDLGGLRLCEELALLDSGQQLTSLQQLHHDVRVQLEHTNNQHCSLHQHVQ